jgi:hypothetical protein
MSVCFDCQARVRQCQCQCLSNLRLATLEVVAAVCCNRLSLICLIVCKSVLLDEEQNAAIAAAAVAGAAAAHTHSAGASR